MTSAYEDIYSCFLKNVMSLNLTSYSVSDAYQLMNEYLRSVAARPNVRRLFSSISFDDDVEEVKYIYKEPFDDEYDKLFFEEMFGLGMVIAWYMPKVDSEIYTNMMVAGRNEKFYAQATHLTALSNRVKHLETKFDKKVASHGYSNFALNGE